MQLKNMARYLLFLLLPTGAMMPDARAQLPAAPGNFAITEINFSPAPISAAEINAGFTDSDQFEFIELKNISASTITPFGVQITNAVQFVFSTPTVIPAGGYVVLVREQAAFEFRYGTNVVNIAGVYSGGLRNSGEGIDMKTSGGTVIHQFAYDVTAAWPSKAIGEGSSLEVKDTAGDYNDPDNWRSSFDYKGSPGRAGREKFSSVVINEILAHTDLPLVDYIEFFNPTTNAVNISGWLVSDDILVPAKYAFPNGTIIPAGGYFTIDENTFNNPGNPNVIQAFALSELGDFVYLFEATNRQPTAEMDDVDFEASQQGSSIGLYLKSTNDTDFTPLSARTPNAANAPPQIGPVIFSEVMYNPATNELEFIELYNDSANPVPFFDPLFPTNTWRFTDGIDFVFPQNVILPGRGRILVTETNPVIFRARYAVPDEVQIFGPYTGGLNNAGEAVRLRSPGTPEPDGFVPYYHVDRITYDDIAPWPEDADGLGPALEKISPDVYSNDPASWRTLNRLGSPGTRSQVDEDNDGAPESWEEVVYGNTTTYNSNPLLDTDHDGFLDYQEYLAGTDPLQSNSVFRVDFTGAGEELSVAFATIVPQGPGYLGLERFYRVESTTNLIANAWDPLPGATNLPASDTTRIWPVLPSQRFEAFRASATLQ